MQADMNSGVFRYEPFLVGLEQAFTNTHPFVLKSMF